MSCKSPKLALLPLCYLHAQWFLHNSLSLGLCLSGWPSPAHHSCSGSPWAHENMKNNGGLWLQRGCTHSGELPHSSSEQSWRFYPIQASNPVLQGGSKARGQEAHLLPALTYEVPGALREASDQTLEAVGAGVPLSSRTCSIWCLSTLCDLLSPELLGSHLHDPKATALL